MSAIAKVSFIFLLFILMANILASMNVFVFLKVPAQQQLYHNILSLALISLLIIISFRYNFIAEPVVNFQQRY
jgi:hypothetical protein